MRLAMMMSVVLLACAACKDKRESAAVMGSESSGSAVRAVPKRAARMTGSATCDSKQRTTLDGIVQLAGGERHACGRKADGTVTCWGDNGPGLLGVGTTADIDGPVQVCNLTDVVEVATTSYHSCVRRTDGSVWCWGANTSGELGDGTKIARSIPVRVVGVRHAIGIAVGSFDSCAIEADGTVVCWGMGAGLAPRVVPGVADAVQIALGSTMCALVKGGTVACWSYEASGIGQPRHPTRPVPVLPLEGVRSINHHGSQACATMLNGTVACWENAERGAWPIPGLADVEMVAVDFSRPCALKRDGTVVCWGDQSQGQLTVAKLLEPHAVAGLDGVTSIAGGHAFFCATKTAGAVMCWGAEPEGRMDQQRAAEAARRQAYESGPKLCPIDQFAIYRKPGCGKDAVHSCASAMPPCAEQFCGCDGKAIHGCGGATAPFRHAGACK